MFGYKTVIVPKKVKNLLDLIALAPSWFVFSIRDLQQFLGYYNEVGEVVVEQSWLDLAARSLGLSGQTFCTLDLAISISKYLKGGSARWVDEWIGADFSITPESQLLTLVFEKYFTVLFPYFNRPSPRRDREDFLQDLIRRPPSPEFILYIKEVIEEPVSGLFTLTDRV